MVQVEQFIDVVRQAHVLREAGAQQAPQRAYRAARQYAERCEPRFPDGEAAHSSEAWTMAAGPPSKERAGPHRVRRYQGQLTTSTVRVTGVALLPPASVTL